MKVILKEYEFTAELNPEEISVIEFEARQGKVHVAPGEYAITTTFGEIFAVTEAQFEEHFEQFPPPKPEKAEKPEKPEKPAKDKE